MRSVHPVGAGVTARAAQERLIGALRATPRHGLRGDEPRVLAETLRCLEQTDADDAPDGPTPGERLAARLARFVAAGKPSRLALADLLALVARELAPAGEPPAGGAAAEAWRATLATVEHLYGGGFRLLGRPDFVGDERLEDLARESRAQPRSETTTGHEVADPGPALRELAVDPRLLALVSDAVGLPVKSTYRAVYMYLSAPVRLPLHVDHEAYEIIVHLTLEHTPPQDGSGRAALFAHRLDKPRTRLPLEPGEALVLRGRGTIHGREPLKAGESWSSTAIGFEPARSRGRATAAA